MQPTNVLTGGLGGTKGAVNTRNSVGGARRYTSGIDAQGKAYLWDATDNQMLYYGEPNDRWETLGRNLRNNLGYKRIWEGDQRASGQAAGSSDASRQVGGANNFVGGGGGGGGSVMPALDQRAIDSLLSEIGNYDRERADSKARARLTRDASRRTKEQEREREEKKYEGESLSNLQDFGSAKTETDLNTANTLESLISSLSTLQMAGGKALTRQILSAANRSNRQANATQAQNQMGLDTARNDYVSGYETDMQKINDQYNYDVGEADKTWGERRRDGLHRVASQYKAAGDTSNYDKYMKQGDSLNSIIQNSSFLNPSYTGKARTIETPDMSSYVQDIAQYSTEGIGGSAPGAPGAPGAGGQTGNMGIRAVAVNDRDAGVKRRQEGDLGYGV